MPDQQGSAEMQSEELVPVQDGPSNEDSGTPENEVETERTLAMNEEETVPDNRASQDTTEVSQSDSISSSIESGIRVALSRRGAELKSQAETLTVTKVRHLLEDDLGLERDGLNVHKQFVRTLVDELLQDDSEEPKVDALEGEHGAEEEAPVKSKGRVKSKEGKSFGGRKGALEEAVENCDNLQRIEASDSISEERRSNKLKRRKKKDNEVETKLVVVKKVIDAKRPSSAEVERLREILKFVGIGVSPIVYKKAKDAPEHEREDVLIKELEKRLAQEGLSSRPTEKEMKKVKARLEKKKDLDGIERSNIVEAPRRSRAAADSWFSPRPKRYSPAPNKNSEDQDSDDDSKAVVTGAMDD